MTDEEKTGVVGCTIIVGIIILIPVVMIGGCVLGYFGEGAAVVRKELGPQELLRKYEWFKDAAAVLDKKQADIKVYQSRLASLEKAYEGKNRTEWARDDREQHSIWSSEVSGIRASYNSLAAEYNAAMSKINWQFCEQGKLPPGASKPLPREYKPYEE